MKSETIVLQKIEIKEPSDYKIIFMNDNVTPMDFVVMILERFFNLDKVTASFKMMKIHNEGSAIIGVYSYSEAETRKALVDNCSKQYHYPLEVKIEKNE